MGLGSAGLRHAGGPVSSQLPAPGARLTSPSGSCTQVRAGLSPHTRRALPLPSVSSDRILCSCVPCLALLALEHSSFSPAVCQRQDKSHLVPVPGFLYS